MNLDALDWILRAVMVAVSIGVFVWGRSQKQADDLLTEKVVSLRHLITDGLTAQDKMLLLQLAVRDQQLLSIHSRLDQAGEKASAEASRVMAKLNDLDHRVAVLETRVDDRRSL